MFRASFVFLLVTVVTFTRGFLLIGENNPALVKLSEDCALELGLDMTEMKNIDPKDVGSFKKLLENKNFKCYGKCVALKGGIATEEGVVDSKKISEQFKLSEEQSKIVDTCVSKISNEDLCLKVNLILACIYKDGKQ